MVSNFYDEWLANEVHQYTEIADLKAVPRKFVVNWILKTWREILKEMIIHSM